MSLQRELLEKCCKIIEQKLSWGDSANWQNLDFERLSEVIFQDTRSQLSVSTLKRIWGKVTYKGMPNLSTLDVLAQYAGFDNWRRFAASHAPDEAIGIKSFSMREKGSRVKRIVISGFFIITGLVIFALVVLFAKETRVKKLEYSMVEFSSNPVTLGLPNTVIFNYQAEHSNADSVFIQQSWDPKLRARVDKQSHKHTTTYYYPGFYKAKLILNDSIVKEHDVFIETDRWVGTIDRNGIPLYLTNQEVEKDGVIGIGAADLTVRGIDIKKEIPSVSLFNVSKQHVVSSYNFKFSAQIRSTCSFGDAVCQKVKVVLVCKSGTFSIPLCIKGCVGEINLVIANKGYPGKKNDLSAFGVDFSNWVSINCESVKGRVIIRVGGKKAFEANIIKDVGDIVGIRYMFKGTGLVKESILSQAF